MHVLEQAALGDRRQRVPRGVRERTLVGLEVESVEDAKLDAVFPSLYAYYDDNAFGTVRVVNREDAAIRDVAKAMLQVKGAGRATPASAPTAPFTASPQAPRKSPKGRRR